MSEKYDITMAINLPQMQQSKTGKTHIDENMNEMLMKLHKIPSNYLKSIKYLQISFYTKNDIFVKIHYDEIASTKYDTS